MKWDKLCALGCELPEVEVDRWWGTPALKVRGNAMCRLKEDGVSVMFGVDNLDEKEALLATQPELYFTTPHYDGYPAILIRLAPLRAALARTWLARAWQVASAAKPKPAKQKQKPKPKPKKPRKPRVR